MRFPLFRAFSASSLLCWLLCACEGIPLLETSQVSSSTAEASYADVSAERLQQIKASGVFKVGVCPGRPPFCVKDSNGSFSGIEIEIVNAVATELKLKPQFFEVGPELASGLLRDGTADLLCGALNSPSITRQFLNPTLEYMPSGLRAVVRSEAAAFLNDPKQLNSDKITLIVIQDGNGTKVASELFPSAKIESSQDFEKGLESLKASEGKALLASNVEILKRGNLASDPKAKPVFGILSQERLAFAARRGDEAWTDLLEIGFRRVRQSGELGRIIGSRFPSLSVGTVDLKTVSESSGAELRLEIDSDSGAKASEK